MNSEKAVVENMGRMGYATKGVLYTIISGLTLTALIGLGGHVGGSEDAIRSLSELAFGKVLLGLTGIGLIAYAGYRAWRAVRNPSGLDGLKGNAKRIGYGVSAIIHGALAVSAFQMLMGSSDGGGGSRSWLDSLLSSGTLGRVAAGIGACILFVIAISEMRTGWKQKFMKHMKSGQMSSREQKTVGWVGTLGHVARGVVFGVMGASLISYVTKGGGEYEGTGEALRTIASQPFGATLLGLCAAGLMAYAATQFAFARYRSFSSV